MVTININIGKKHLFVFCIVIGIVAGMFVAYAYNSPPVWSGAGAAVPSDFGHSVDEINWGQTINKDVSIGGFLSVAGQRVINSDVSSIIIGDVISSDGNKHLVLKAGDEVRVFIDQGNGNVGIGTGTTTPAARLDVAGEVKSSSGFRFSDNSFQTTSAQAGRVVGGGSMWPECSAWGQAYCEGGVNFKCPDKSTPRISGYAYQPSGPGLGNNNVYICITD